MWDWITSDQHHGHTNIIKYENRPFNSIEEMDEYLIYNWNSKVKKHEKVLILGDFSFYGKKKTKEILNKLNGYLSIVLGNHDKRKTCKWWYDAGFKAVYDFPIIVNNIIFSHEPIKNEFHNIHGHVHSKFYNIGVDVNNYYPVRLKDFINL